MRSPRLAFAAIACFFALSALGSPFIGQIAIPVSDLISGEGTARAVFFELRVPRVLAALLAGGALSLSGVAFQALFRNPLAAPFTLGVSSGAGLGASLYVRLGLAITIAGVSGIALAAFAGAAGAMLLVYGLARARGSLASNTLLLAGVAISFTCSSLILFVQYTADLYDSFRMLRWMMGGLGVVGYADLRTLAPFALGGGAVILLLRRELDLLLTGEELAQARGLDIARTQTLLFFAVSFMVGGVVAVCGPIGFIGLIAPHVARLLVGHSHRWLAPAAMLFGAGFLALSDAVARTVFAPAEIPVGVLTAMLGGPFFLLLLLTRGPGFTGNR
ncbi:MAG: iron chelate uptake ABC transporter family permease subunit [Candidatus Hydrogenedens sp.]|nr:iron chelate uptake ABC transporter family permease subunit [Candidatus Hydrogenedens sp.]